MAESNEESNAGRKPPTTRKTVAVGDLHGDYARLTRILYQEGLLIEGTWAWNPDARGVDLILIGDYVDWRGEPLEGDPSRWKEGPKRTLHLIYYLFHKLRELREMWGEADGFDSYIHPILGNHDQMMLDALQIFDFMDFDQINQVISFRQNYAPLKKFLNEIRLDYDQIDKVMKFLNWYYQGGDATIEGFGGMEIWKEEMDGQLGDFLRNNLLLGCVVNHRLYSHSLPDRREFWRPIQELIDLPEKEKIRAREAFIWGRRIWGIDAYTNMKTPQPEMTEINEMLTRMGVQGAVVGHTPMLRREPLRAFEGKIINIDLHGIPGSGAFLEDYALEDQEDAEPVDVTAAQVEPESHQPENPEPETAQETTDEEKPEELSGKENHPENQEDQVEV